MVNITFNNNSGTPFNNTQLYRSVTSSESDTYVLTNDWAPTQVVQNGSYFKYFHIDGGHANAGKWVDADSGAPSGFNTDGGTTFTNSVVNAATIYITDGTNTADFTSPYAVATTGGGTGTEGVATIGDAEGNLSNNPSFQEMDVSISALSPFGTDYTYNLLKDNVTVDTRQPTSTTRNYSIDYSSVGQYGVWDLTVTEVSTLTIRHLRRLTLTDPTLPTTNKKVFCNFW